MALSWDCSPAKSCYDLGRARYTMDSQHVADSTKTHGDAVDFEVQVESRSPKKVRFGWQQHSDGDRGGDDSPAEGSAQDVCSYPTAAFGPPFAPPRCRITACLPARSSLPREVTSNKCIAVRRVATPLRELTCHMGSHSVTCHPAEMTFPPLPQPKLVLD